MWVKATDHQQSLNPSVLVYLFISSICLHKSHAMGEWEWYSFCLRAKDEEGKGVSDVLKGVSSPLVYFILGPKSKPKYNCPNQLLNNCSISIQTHWMFLWTFIKKHLFLNYIGCSTVINSSATWKHDIFVCLVVSWRYIFWLGWLSYEQNQPLHVGLYLQTGVLSNMSYMRLNKHIKVFNVE